jgi:ankyrin repeat protein
LLTYSSPVPSLGLHFAAATGDVGLVEYALCHGQPINSVLDGVLPLHAACAGGNIQVVKVLIDHGADVNAPRLVVLFSFSSHQTYIYIILFMLLKAAKKVLQ